MALEQLVKEFIQLLEIEEETDDGRRFRPNQISSCRVMDGQKMVDLLLRMKEQLQIEDDMRSEE